MREPSVGRETPLGTKKLEEIHVRIELARGIQPIFEGRGWNHVHVDALVFVFIKAIFVEQPPHKINSGLNGLKRQPRALISSQNARRAFLAPARLPVR